MSYHREIERKFLVNIDLFNDYVEMTTRPVSVSKITQGYLHVDDQKVIRIRKIENQDGVHGLLTIKIKDQNAGVDELEYDVSSADEINKLLSTCKVPLIEKIRYVVDVYKSRWEVDVFEGHKKGLVLGEIELKSIEDKFSIPEWLEDEVTGNPEYSNSNM